MNEQKFKEKVRILHYDFGVPYSQIAKKLNITGAYLSIICNGKKPVTERVLEEAERCYMFAFEV